MAQSSGTSLLRIGTRGSPLALAQAGEVRAELAAAHGLDPSAIELHVIRTSGDQITDRPLAEAGGKGLFVKEIEEALLAGAIDLAVHSAKDLPTILPSGLALASCLEREDVREAFVSHKAASIAELPAGAVVGTASPRRTAQVLRMRPDLKTALLRGNIETRLRKVETGEVDATLLALAGLRRLGLADAATAIFEIEECLPAAAQGAIAVEIRADDDRTRRLLAAIDHPDTSAAIAAERAFLEALGGSCRTAIAAHASVSETAIRLRGQVLRPDGSEAHDTERSGPRRDAIALAADAGRELKARAGPAFFVD